ncbi:MAG: DUF4874 domain-containing protein [Eubacterium sp.]|nr:DUF4874 domain-containing protein [Eubacterium sp.]
MCSYTPGKEDPSGVGPGAIHDGETMVLFEICLSEYSRKPLDDAVFKGVDSILSYFAREGRDVIVRVSYDLEGKAAVTEPTSIEEVFEHIESLVPVINGHDSIIPVFQGVFVGNWGEMHGSRFSSDAYLCRLYKRLRGLLSEKITVAFRRPAFRRLFPKDDTALFNDAIMATETDLGTYAQGERQKELVYQNAAVLHAFNGGEALYPSSEIKAAKVDKELSMMHIGYLNSVYDARVFELWKRIDAPAVDEEVRKLVLPEIRTAFRQSLYETVKARLGYRLIVTDVRKKGADVFVDVVNMGYGAVVFDSVLVISAGESEQTFSVDAGSFEPSAKMEFKFNAFPGEKGVYPLRVALYRKWDERPVVFANEGADAGGSIVGELVVK